MWRLLRATSTDGCHRLRWQAATRAVEHPWRTSASWMSHARRRRDFSSCFFAPKPPGKGCSQFSQGGSSSPALRPTSREYGPVGGSWPCVPSGAPPQSATDPPTAPTGTAQAALQGERSPAEALMLCWRLAPSDSPCVDRHAGSQSMAVAPVAPCGDLLDGDLGGCVVEQALKGAVGFLGLVRATQPSGPRVRPWPTC